MTISGQPIRTVAPTAQPISVSQAKRHLRVTHNDDDVLIVDYIRRAVARLEDYTGLGLLQQTWTQTFPAFSNPMLLYRRPLLAVGSPLAAAIVTYADTDGATQTLADTVYRVTGVGADRAYGAVRLANGQSWPATLANDEEAITVTYTVGYGTNETLVPEVLKQAILIMIADWYAFRESLHEGSFAEIPFGAMALLREWRPLAVA